MQMSLKQINAAIQKTEPHVELVKHGSGGKGYFVYVYNNVVDGVLNGDESIFETETVYTPFLYMKRVATWIAEGLDFAAKVRERVAERA